MAKQPQPGENIHIAPGITGKMDDHGELFISDDSNEEKLFPNRNIEDKIRIFKKQVNGWFLERASILQEDEINGFVVLMIATAYIEGIEQYRKGQSSNGRSRSFFTEGLERIFGINCSDSQSLDVYSELRCELFHNGMTGPNVRISSSYSEPIDISDEKIIKINQKLFLEKIKEDFDNYLLDLMDTNQTELITNFNSMYKFE